MNKFLATGWHYIIGLALIGALAGLAAVGVVSGVVVVPIIASVGSALGVGGLVNNASSNTPVVITPTPVSTTTTIAKSPVSAVQ